MAEQSFLSRLFGRKAAVSEQSLVTTLSWQRYSWDNYGFWDIVRKAYKGNPTAFACASILATTFPEPKLYGWQPGDEDGQYVKARKHPVRELMSLPNPDLGEAELMQFAIIYASLSGNVYFWKQPGRGGQTVALWPYHDGHMRPVAGKSTAEGLVKHYVLETEDAQVIFPKEEIIHWKWMIDPEHPWRGIGALEAATQDIQMATNARSYVKDLLKNDGTPPLVITMAEGDEFDPDKTSRLRKEWREAHSGANRGSPAFVEYGMTVQPVGFDLDKLNYQRLVDGPDASICSGFGIHPAVVGAMIGLQHSTYSNYEEARAALTKQTLVPRWRGFESELTASFRDEPGYRDSVLMFDRGEVEALQEDRDALWERANNAWLSGLLQRSEARAILGYASTGEDDIYKETSTFGSFNEPPTLPKSTHKPHDATKTAGIHEPDADTTNEPQKAAHDHWHDEALDYKAGFPDGDGGASDETAPADAYRALRRSIAKLRGVREQLIPQMASDIQDYFDAYAQRVEDELLGDGKALTTWDFFRVLEILYRQARAEDLEIVMKTYTEAIITESWGVWNAMLKVERNLTQTDPLVAVALATAGERVKNINETTLTALRATLQHGSDAGWSIGELVRGKDGVPGIRDVVVQTYKGRAETIARTELGTAQQNTATARYESSGVQFVMVFDNGFDNSDPVCTQLDGTVQKISWAKANPLQHPRCVRAFGPYYPEA